MTVDGKGANVIPWKLTLRHRGALDPGFLSMLRHELHILKAGHSEYTEEVQSRAKKNNHKNPSWDNFSEKLSQVIKAAAKENEIDPK